ncbi:hypothetical protein os1_29800 [Comamonadaceae bacterium OS-1]|nr:hypothetical protein os1_29800 [Comamonadaceae bacterium OS-1]
MPTICPKCRAVRPADATVPEWQCPFCGVAYAKAGGGGMAQPASTRHAPLHGSSQSHAEAGIFASIPWGKLFAVVAIAYGAWVGLHRGGGSGSFDAFSRQGHFGSSPSPEQLGQLAANGKLEDVLMYSAAWCTNCAAAKSWMAQYGFKYQECDVDASSACASELRKLDPQGGIPYLIVKGRHMKDGFDSDEFLAALTQ